MQLSNTFRGHCELVPFPVNQVQRGTVATQFLFITIAQRRRAENKRTDALILHFDAFNPVG